MAKEDQPKNPIIEKLRALQIDAERDIERLEEEVRNGNGGGGGQKPARGNENRSNNPKRNEGQQDGSFVPRLENPKPVIIEKPQKQPTAGLEIKPQKNKSAELIRELGNVSFPIKTVCVYLSRCFKVGDNETSDIMTEKFRLTEIFNELREASDELIKMITSRDSKPSMEDLEINKAQITVGVMELLWEIDSLDLSLSKSLPEEDTVEWRKIETAKNQLRKFVGDNESVTTISPILRFDTLTPKSNPVETGTIDDTIVTEPIVKSPDEKLAEEKDRNGKIIEKAKKGEVFTIEQLKMEGLDEESATNLLTILNLIKAEVTV